MAVELAAEPLDAAGQIDVGTDHGEIEPVVGADIAVGNRSVMQRDADPQLRPAAVAAVALAYGGETLGGGGERGFAGLCGTDLWPAPEDRQHAVAHDLHDLAAMLANRRDHVVEIVVEEAHHGARIHRV